MYICPIVDLYYNKMESKTPSREKEIYKVTVVGSVVNFLLLVFKFFAGIAGHSAAMLADAVHSLSDFVTDIIVIVFVRISNKPEDKDHDYGHGKYETLATAIIGIVLLSGYYFYVSALVSFGTVLPLFMTFFMENSLGSRACWH